MIQTIGYRNGNLLSFAQYGDPKGFPILVQHGLIASIKQSAISSRLLDMGARLICTARPGYGESTSYRMQNMAEWGEIVSVLVGELDLSHFDILGMSSGAPYSYALGWKFPDKARNIFIFSGIPAMYDDKILAFWPFAVDKAASLPELQELAYTLFFSNLSPQDKETDDIRDSLRNHCFGLAQDFRLRCNDWGFSLAEVKQNVYMRHDRRDGGVPFITAEMTAKLLPNCQLDVKENGIHFSAEALDDFIRTVMAGRFGA